MTNYKSRLLAACCLFALTFTAQADITILQEPTGANVRAGSRARFSINATSTAINLYYQWFLNGFPIPNADKATYVTPVLSTTDTSNVYLVQVGDVTGQTNLSAPAYLWVGCGTTPQVLPSIGVNFLSADVNQVGPDTAGFLWTNNVAGFVAQENFVNLSQLTTNGAPLFDSHGTNTPVTITYGPVSQGATGTGASDWDHALFQGYLQNSTNSISITLSNVLSGPNYSLLVYSVGATNNTPYDESFSLVGQSNYPTLHVRAQDAGQYLAAPAYARMTSTDRNHRDRGNYVQFDNVSPAADKTLVLVVTPESNSPAPVCAVQLVTVQPPPILPRLSTSYLAVSNLLSISWDATAVGYALELSPVLGPNPSWAPVAGVASPITNANSVTVSATSGSNAFVTMIQKGCPFIIQQPQSQIVEQFTNVSFSVIATGAPLLTYQWKFNGTNIPFATNSTYIIPAVDFTNVGDYQVTVTDAPVDSLKAGLSVYSLSGNFGTLATPISQFYAPPPNGTYTCPAGLGGKGPFDKEYVPRDTHGVAYHFYGPMFSGQQTGPFVNSAMSTGLQLDSSANMSTVTAVELQPPTTPLVCDTKPPPFTLSPQQGYWFPTLLYHTPPPTSQTITNTWNYLGP